MQKRRKKSRRIGHVGQAYLEALERKRRQTAKTIRAIGGGIHLGDPR